MEAAPVSLVENCFDELMRGHKGDDIIRAHLKKIYGVNTPQSLVSFLVKNTEVR